jgi:hypothetical protein
MLFRHACDAGSGRSSRSRPPTVRSLGNPRLVAMVTHADVASWCLRIAAAARSSLCADAARRLCRRCCGLLHLKLALLPTVASFDHELFHHQFHRLNCACQSRLYMLERCCGSSICPRTLPTARSTRTAITQSRACTLTSV